MSYLLTFENNGSSSDEPNTFYVEDDIQKVFDWVKRDNQWNRYRAFVLDREIKSMDEISKKKF